MIVTAVERKGRRRTVSVFVDGAFALELGVDLAIERGVRPGRALKHGELAALREMEARRSALQAALRLLSYRPRSEQELRQRLFRKGYKSGVVQRALDRVRELGYLDDAAFARFWSETRQNAHPQSRRMAIGELRRRGIERETAEEATETISDEEAALEAAKRRLRSLAGLEYQKFRERLGSFLTRRGFSYDVARGVIDTCWAELHNEKPEEPD